MKKKKDDFYFKNLNTCVGLSAQAAALLKETMEHYDASLIKDKMDKMHECEQQADAKKHKMMNALSQAFITPIEREDLMALSSYLDDITDAIEEVMMHFYMCNVTEIRRDALDMVALLPEALDALADVLGELKNFKHSKTINDAIVRVNDLEEKGDKLYMESLHRLYQEDNVMTVLKWRDIYEGLERCLDTCEHAADIVQTVIMKNS